MSDIVAFIIAGLVIAHFTCGVGPLLSWLLSLGEPSPPDPEPTDRRDQAISAPPAPPRALERGSATPPARGTQRPQPRPPQIRWREGTARRPAPKARAAEHAPSQPTTPVAAGTRDALTREPLKAGETVWRCGRCEAAYREQSYRYLREANGARCGSCNAAGDLRTSTVAAAPDSERISIGRPRPTQKRPSPATVTGTPERTRPPRRTSRTEEPHRPIARSRPATRAGPTGAALLPLVPAGQARRHYGQRVRLQGTIQTVRRSRNGNTIFLDLSSGDAHRDRLKIVLFLPVALPLEREHPDLFTWAGRCVTVTGLLQNHGTFGPQLVCRSPDDLEVSPRARSRRRRGR